MQYLNILFQPLLRLSHVVDEGWEQLSSDESLPQNFTIFNNLLTICSYYRRRLLAGMSGIVPRRRGKLRWWLHSFGIGYPIGALHNYR
jgi:hypothetical protein